MQLLAVHPCMQQDHIGRLKRNDTEKNRKQSSAAGDSECVAAYLVRALERSVHSYTQELNPTRRKRNHIH